MTQNLELTDTGIVALEAILFSYQRHAPDDDRALVTTLANRTGDVMEKAHTGSNPMDPQTHMYYTETPEETDVLQDALDWAIENGRQEQLATQIRHQL